MDCMKYVYSYVVYNLTRNQQVKPLFGSWQIGTNPNQWTWERIIKVMKWKKTDRIVALTYGSITQAFRLHYPHYFDQSQFHDGPDSSANDEDFAEHNIQTKIKERKYEKFLIDTTTSIVSVERVKD